MAADGARRGVSVAARTRGWAAGRAFIRWVREATPGQRTALQLASRKLRKIEKRKETAHMARLLGMKHQTTGATVRHGTDAIPARLTAPIERHDGLVSLKAVFGQGIAFVPLPLHQRHR